MAPLINSNGVPTGGGDEVRANLLFDAHLSYTVDRDGAFDGTEIYVDVTNVFDRDPPFYNTATGFDRYAASPIGRVVSVGARARF